MNGEEMLAKYLVEANGVAEPRRSLDVPMTVFFGEAIDVAGFVKKYWQPVVGSGGTVLRPGLSQLNRADSVRLRSSIATEIDELVAAATAAHQRYTFALEPEGKHPMTEAEALLSELTAALEFLFDDGKETPEDATLARLGELHAEPTTQDAMALALEDYAALARPQRDALDGLGDFDPETIERATLVAAALRQRSAPTSKSSTDQLLLRDQVLTLLYNRIREVRRAASYIFRNQPEIARLATSSYQRRRRAAARRKKAAATGVTPPVATT